MLGKRNSDAERIRRSLILNMPKKKKSCSYELIDCSHFITEKIPTWDGTSGLKYEVVMDYDKGFRVQKLHMLAGLSTHIDAPSHCKKGGQNVASIPLQNLFCPFVVIDVSKKSSPDLIVSLDDIKNYEKKFGKILPGSFVAINTGWHRFWNNPKKYRNVGGDKKMHFPSVSTACARYLLVCSIAGLGIDTLSPDGPDLTFPVHKLLLRNNCYIVENLAFPKKQFCRTAFSVIAPLKLKNGSESPVRVFVVETPSSQEIGQ